MPQPTDPDDHHARAGTQQRNRLSDDMHHSEAGIRMRCHRGRLQARRQYDYTAVGRPQPLGEPARAGQPVKSSPFAQRMSSPIRQAGHSPHDSWG